ncbi:DUF6000 family protein [Streptomyces parvus]|uniref:DUF6000 family protein n=1 Tax=Streptomyces parvus TaxID=66428 RepID=UPI003819EF91
MRSAAVRTAWSSMRTRRATWGRAMALRDLDRYLRRPDLAYDQTAAMGALVFIDLNLQGDQAARFLGPGALWQQWLHDAPHMQGTTDPTPSSLSLIRRLCAFVDECAESG